MISGDLDTEAASNVNDQKPSFFQSMLRSFGGQSSTRNGIGAPAGNRSRSNTGQLAHVDEPLHGAQSIAYAASLSSLSFFIHDGSVSTDEADDPYNAICFFHPPNYTPTEQWEFTGPIVGAVRFMTSFANSPPKIIHLANSSIALLCFDQYTIALKASKVLCHNSLEACIRDLYSVFSLFFNDLKFMKKLCRDDDPDVALGRFKYNLAHIWTKLIGLVGPHKLLHPIAHIPHFLATQHIETQLYQFFACIIAILSGFSNNTFGCLLAYESQLVQSTFDVSLTRTLMLASSLIRTMPQTAHVLPTTSRLPKSAFVRYGFAARSQLLTSRLKLRNQLKSLPPAAQMFLGRFAPSMVDSAFLPRQSQSQTEDWTNPPRPSEVADAPDTPNSAILSRYFDFAWALAGQQGDHGRPGSATFDASFSTNLSRNQDNQFGNQENNGDHWESRSSSMSSVAVNLNGLYSSSYSPLIQMDPNRSRSVSMDEQHAQMAFPSANFDQLWADNGSSGKSAFGRSPRRSLRPSSSTDPNQDPFGQIASKLAHVLRPDEDDEDRFNSKFFTSASNEDQAFSSLPRGSTASKIAVQGAIRDTVLTAASRLSTATEHSSEDKKAEAPSLPFLSNNGFLDSGHSSIQGIDALLDENLDVESNHEEDANATLNSETGRQTGDSGNGATNQSSASLPQLLDEDELGDVVETVLYVQSHGPLSLIAVVPNSPSVVKAEQIRRLYDIMLPILADVCSLLMHLESESARAAPTEAVVVSFEPSRQRLHRLGLCRACNSDIRFDTQLFSIQRLFAKDPNIRDLQISDWTSHVRVTKETNPPPGEASDLMAPYHQASPGLQNQQQGRHSYIKVKRNGCASSLVVLPSAQ